MMQRIYRLVTTVVMVAVMVTASYAPVAAADEWDKVLAAAKKEGTVSVIGPVGSDRRDTLTLAFEKKYGIKVDYLGDRGSGIGPKITAERNAGQFLWDVFIGGTTTALSVTLPAGMLDPIEPALILPQVKDPKQWRGGKIEYLDPGKRVMVMMLTQRGTLYVNPKVTKPESITSYKDLLAPKFKRKIVMDDPTNAGPGQATFTFFYLHPALGPNFIRELAKQEPTVLKDYTQELEGVAREKFLVLIGVSDIFAQARIEAGMPIAILDPRKIKEGTDIGSVSGALTMFNHAPHPNAAKVYINWLLSKEGQTAYALLNGNISTRLDVPTDHAPWRVPMPKAIETYSQKAIDVKDEVIAVFKEAFGRK